MLTGLQLRAARAMLRWTIQDLADRSGVSVRTIRSAEAIDGVPRMRTNSMHSLMVTLEQAGVEFIRADNGGPGVRWRRR